MQFEEVPGVSSLQTKSLRIATFKDALYGSLLPRDSELVGF